MACAACAQRWLAESWQPEWESEEEYEIHSGARSILARLVQRPALAKAAQALVGAVESRSLGGIVPTDHPVSARLARQMRRSPEQLIPPGAGAAVVTPKGGGPPTLVFRRLPGQPEGRLGADLLRASGLARAASRIRFSRRVGGSAVEAEFPVRPGLLSKLVPKALAKVFKVVVPILPVLGIGPKIRRLYPAEIAGATPVFGKSLDFGRILISSALAPTGDFFTLYLPGVGTVLNMGPEAYPNATGVHEPTLIHELVHSWQSQHHFDRMAYEANSLLSQAQAWVLKEHAYCYKPGKSFGSYAAEQIALAVEKGFIGKGGPHEAAITAHIRSVPRWVPDPQNILSLALTRTEKPGAPGVVCP